MVAVAAAAIIIILIVFILILVIVFIVTIIVFIITIIFIVVTIIDATRVDRPSLWRGFFFIVVAGNNMLNEHRHCARRGLLK